MRKITANILSKEYALDWNMGVEQWHNFDEVAEKFKLNVTDNKSFLNENKYYVVINDEVDNAADRIMAIIRAEHAKCDRTLSEYLKLMEETNND